MFLFEHRSIHFNRATIPVVIRFAAAFALNLLPGATVLDLVAQPARTDGDWVFEEVARLAGIDFVHENGMSGEYYLPEITGSGVALFDYDNDGDLDAYFVQSGRVDNQGSSGPSEQGPGDSLTDRLYRNDLFLNDDGVRVLRFTDVTRNAGIEGSGYGMGVAVGDFNNDGWPDLYVTNVGPNQMLKNNQDGTFADVTRVAGTDDPRWSTSASFVDLNRDGWLDLYVANYVDFSIQANRICYAANSSTDFCGPDAYNPEGDSLFLNKGDGTFEDWTSQSRVYSELGAGLGVVTADFNGDGWIDIYVANDGDANLLWVNQKNGTLLNDGLLAGVALNNMGSAEASMGVDAGDFDEDGDMDLFMTHIMEETNTLYQNDGGGLFEDRTIEMKLSVPSLRRTAFGTTWVDFDNDGWLDLIVLNGAVRIIEELAKLGDPYPLHQPNQLFRNDGNGAFTEVSTRGGPAFQVSEVSRGVASGDIDNDGDLDLFLLNNQGPAHLLLNRVGNRNNWIGLRFMGRDLKRDLLGATVKVSPDEGHVRYRRVRTDGSYCSASDPRVLVGLGSAEKVVQAQVTWPDGRVEEWNDLEVNRYHRVWQRETPARQPEPGTEEYSRHETLVEGVTGTSALSRTDEAERLVPVRQVVQERKLSSGREDLKPVSLPSLELLEPIVSAQLRAVEEGLKELVSSTDVTDEELGLAYGNAAEVYHAYELFRAAEACYLNAIQLIADDFRWPYMMGLLFHAEGRLDETLVQYRRARVLRTDYSAILINMGDVYLQKNELEMAGRAFRLALESGSNLAAAQYGLGRVYLNQREFQKSVEYLESVISTIPQANRVHHSLAMAYRGLGDLNKASSHLGQLGPIGLRPVDPLFDHLRELMRGERSHMLRGRKAFAAGDFMMAAEEFRRAVEADPNSVRSQINLGAALSQIGDDSGAVKALQKALVRDPGNASAHFNLGILLAKSGDNKAAEQHLLRVVELRPGDSEAHFRLAQVLMRRGQVEEALDSFAAAVRTNPNHEEAILEEVSVLVKLRRFGPAVERLESAHQHLPHQGRIAYALARILASCPERQLRDGRRALELALRIYRARPTVAHAETVALALAEMGRCEEAAEWQEGAILGARQGGQEDRAAAMGRALEAYRNGSPCQP